MEDDTQTTMTRTQLEAFVKAEMARMDRVDATRRDARSTYDMFVTNHLLAQGEAGATIRAELEKKHGPDLRKAEAAALRQATIAEANVEIVLNQTASTDPVLTAEEMRQAASRREFLAEDAQLLSYAGLTAAVRNALTGDDRAALYCYLRYVPARFDADRQADPSWSDAATSTGADTSELRKLLREARERLADRSYEPLRKSAQAVMSRALKVQRDIEKQTPRETAYEFQVPGEIARCSTDPGSRFRLAPRMVGIARRKVEP